MEDKAIYLIISVVLLILTEILPFLPTRSQGLIHALTVIAEDSYESYKSTPGSQPK